MGASKWDYIIPYQSDLDAALQTLRQQVFAAGDYWWAHGDLGTSAKEYDNIPPTIDELLADSEVQEDGTHSIIDMWHVLAEDEEPDFGTVQPVSAAEALEYAGTARLTREHIDALDRIPLQRWFGRCAVLHDAQSQPSEIYFWGFSGD